MAYFSNGSDGDILEAQCAKCKMGDGPCPIIGVHLTYNYEQIGNELARKILDGLVDKDGICLMLKRFSFLVSQP